MGDWPTLLDKSATLTLSNGRRVFVASPLGLGNIGLEIAKYQTKSIRGTVCCALEGRQDKNISKMLQLMQMQAGMNAAKLNAQDLPQHVGESLRWGKLIALALPAATPVPLSAALGTAKALSGTLVDIPALSDIDMENPDVPKMSEAERMMWVVLKCGEILDKTGKAQVAAAFKQLLDPKVIGMVVAGLIVWGASHFVGVGFILDIAAVVVMGLAVLKAFEVMWDIYKIISSTATKNDLERAAQKMADMVIDLGVETFLAIVLKGAAKSRFRPAPNKATGSADEVVEMAPVRKREGPKPNYEKHPDAKPPKVGKKTFKRVHKDGQPQDPYTLQKDGKPMGANEGRRPSHLSGLDELPAGHAESVNEGWPDLDYNGYKTFETFSDAKAVDLKPGDKIYRIVDENAGNDGGFWAYEIPKNKSEWRKDYAVKDSWNDNGYYVEHTVGKDGLKAWSGKAAGQNYDDGKFHLPGQGEQLFVTPGTIAPSPPQLTKWPEG